MIHVVLEGGVLVYRCDSKLEAMGLKTFVPDAKIEWPGWDQEKTTTTLKKAADPVPQHTSEVLKKEATTKPVESEEDKKRKRYLRDTLKKMGKTYPRGTTLETLEADYLANKPEDDLVATEPKTESKEDVFSNDLPDDNDGNLFGDEDEFEGGAPKALVKEITEGELRNIIIGVLNDENNDITNVKAKSVLLNKFGVNKLDELTADKRAPYLEALGIKV